jgi:carbon monoxide dehydrogenase subunit G
VKLDHQFTVPAPLDEVWLAVIDPERVAPCMPGATLTKVEGDAFSGTVKVKMGPISLLYKGTGEFLEKDAIAGKVVIKAAGKDARGAGTAAATVTLILTADGASTNGAVVTDLAITGKPAQFGRGLISEVGGKILDTFVACLSDKLGASAEPEAEPEPAPEAASASASASANSDRPKPHLESVKPAPEAEAIDLFDYAGRSVVKRLAPVVAGAAVLLIVIAIIRARRR